MKKFEAFYKEKENNGKLLSSKGELIATEVRYTIIAVNEERAMELIAEEGENPVEFELEQVSGVKDQMGRYFPESIRDARI